MSDSIAYYVLVTAIAFPVLLVLFIKNKRKYRAYRLNAEKQLQEAAQKVENCETLSAQWKKEMDSVKEERRKLQEKEERLEGEARQLNAEVDRLRPLKKYADIPDAEAELETLRAAAIAIRNQIEGYGNEYLKPVYMLMDELAYEMAHTEPGQKLRLIRADIRKRTKARETATCADASSYRAAAAIDFITDAFNGKVDSILSRTKSDNYGKLEQEIKDAFATINLNGQAFDHTAIRKDYLELRLLELKWACAAQELKKRQQEEQRAMREKMREEEKVRREIEKQQKEAQKEKALAEAAMEKARAELEAAYAAADAEKRKEWEAKLAELEQRAREAEEKNQRALSQAQLTKRGNVYIISNIGSFGENVYKIGMTRRLVPEERIKELGDASVPFPFDIHALIESDDAPALETSLHRAFLHAQMNKVNPRKEYYKVSIKDIRDYLEKNGIQTQWTMTAEAAEYHETQRIEEEIRQNPAVRAEWERNMEAYAVDAD